MGDLWQRFVGDLLGRLDGPLHFRFVLQPLVVVVLAIVYGVRDARAGRPASFRKALSDPAHRKEVLREGWKRLGKVIIIATVLDVGYQLIAMHRFYPGETLVVAFALAIVPYLVVRGPVTYLVRVGTRKGE